MPSIQIHTNVTLASCRPFWGPIIHSPIKHFQMLLSAQHSAGYGGSQRRTFHISALQSLQSSGGWGGHSVGKHNQAWGVVAALGTCLEGLT